MYGRRLRTVEDKSRPRLTTVSAVSCQTPPLSQEHSMPSSVPVIDLRPWFGGDEQARAAVAAEVDAALQSVGFFLITGHGVPDELRAQVRAQARSFFALPAGTKQRYAVTVGGRGWLPPGVEANGYAEGIETPPDLKESYAVGADQPRTWSRWSTSTKPTTTR
jgi:isopenicillin N synthase-like dioxygenase